MMARLKSYGVDEYEMKNYLKNKYIQPIALTSAFLVKGG